MRHIQEALPQDVIWADGIALGTPTQLGCMSSGMKAWWDEHSRELWSRIDGKIGTAFTSAGSWGGGGELALMNCVSMMMNFGFLVFGTTDYSGPKTSYHYGAVSAGAPQEDAVRDACLQLGQRLSSWVAVYKDGREELHPHHLDRAKRFPHLGTNP